MHRRLHRRTRSTIISGFTVGTGLLVAALATGLSGCQSNGGLVSGDPGALPVPVADGTVVGETRQLGTGPGASTNTLANPLPTSAGTFTSFVSFAGGKPTQAGVTFPASSLVGLPGGPVFTRFTLPPGTAFDHLEVRFFPAGTAPNQALDTVLLNTYFFLITQAQRAQITAVGPDLAKVFKAPLSGAVPVGYAQIPNQDQFFADPQFGIRYFNLELLSAAGQLIGQPLSRGPIFYGYYNGIWDFNEFPTAVNFLRTKTDTNDPFPLPALFPKHGYYPTTYGIHYDPLLDQYTIAVHDFIAR